AARMQEAKREELPRGRISFVESKLVSGIDPVFPLDDGVEGLQFFRIPWIVGHRPKLCALNRRVRERLRVECFVHDLRAEDEGEGGDGRDAERARDADAMLATFRDRMHHQTALPNPERRRTFGLARC